MFEPNNIDTTFRPKYNGDLTQVLILDKSFIIGDPYSVEVRFTKNDFVSEHVGDYIIGSTEDKLLIHHPSDFSGVVNVTLKPE